MAIRAPLMNAPTNPPMIFPREASMSPPLINVISARIKFKTPPTTAKTMASFKTSTESIAVMLSWLDKVTIAPLPVLARML